MCDIAGVLATERQPLGPPDLERMCRALEHRGPDDEGYFHNQHVALAQRRLSIIDLSAGRQPTTNEDGSVWVTFNGEIYNFQELRADLERAGHRFATHSDTETIVHACEQKGYFCPTLTRRTPSDPLVP